MTSAASKAKPSRPIIIGHRGASADRPEHTLAAYSEAIAQGADYIEPDLVMTKDGVLVARHENEISSTTDVASKAEFAARQNSEVIDGETYSGWFVEDFTLAELKTLRARERLAQLRPHNMAYDGQFDIPTFDEIIALALRETVRTKRRIGLYPETKHPSHHHRLGLPQEDALLRQLQRHGFSSAADPVFIQSFEVGNLKALRARTSIRLIQLVSSQGSPADSAMSYQDMLGEAGLAAIARYASGIGAAKSLLLPVDATTGALGPPAPLLRLAHAAGLLVHGWTFRPESHFLPPSLAQGLTPVQRGNGTAEIAAFLRAGVDGVFCDHPADGVAALEIRAKSG